MTLALVFVFLLVSVVQPIGSVLHTTEKIRYTPGTAGSTIAPGRAGSSLGLSPSPGPRGPIGLDRWGGPASARSQICPSGSGAGCSSEPLSKDGPSYRAPEPRPTSADSPEADLSELNWSNQTDYLDDGGGGPEATAGVAAAYDPILGSLVVFGGGCDYCASNDLWEYGGSGWENATADQESLNGLPPPLVSMSAAWDPAWNGVVVAGGFYANGTASNQTWLFGSEWKNITAATTGTGSLAQPPAAGYGSMAYDGKLNELVFVDGCGPTKTCEFANSATWVLGGPGSTWSQIGGGPNDGGAWGGEMAYDNESGYLVYFGGATYKADRSGILPLNDTWIMTSAGWTNITANSSGIYCVFSICAPFFYPAQSWFGQMTWDGQIGAIVLFGGENLTGGLTNQTYIFSDGVWTPEYLYYNDALEEPPPRFLGAMPSDSSVIAPVYVGGIGSVEQNLGNDSWVLDLPPQPTVAGVGPDPADVGAPVEVQISNAVGTGSGPLFEFTAYNAPLGNESGVDSHGPTALIPFSYDGTGSWEIEGWVSDFFGVVGDAVNSVLLTVNANVTGDPSATLVEAGDATVFASGASGGTSPYAYRWGFGDGAQSTLPAPSHTYAASGSYEAWLNLSDAGGGYSNRSVKVAVDPDLTVAAQTNLTASAGQTDVNTPVTFSATPGGGSSDYTGYAWEFGDATTGSGESTTHAYSAKGTYTANITVTDSLGYSKKASVGVQVNGAVGATIAALPPSPRSGSAVGFSATPTGGTAPYSYAWSFGDSATGTGATPTHTYTSGGTYTVTLVITDALGEKSTVRLSLSVSSPPSTSLVGNLSSATALYLLLVAVVVAGVLLMFVGKRRGKGGTVAPPPNSSSGTGSSHGNAGKSPRTGRPPPIPPPGTT